MNIIIFFILVICLICFIITEYINKINPIIIDSGNEGNILLLIGGTHGNEPASSIGLINFLQSGINLSRGKIIIIPDVNKLGLFFNIRYSFDGFIPVDYNRQYPTNIYKKSNNYVNKQILKYIEKADFILDFHEGWDYNVIQPKSLGSGIYPSNTKKAQEIGKYILESINNIIYEDNKKFTLTKNLDKIDGTLLSYTNIVNKNYILIETTGQNNVQHIDIRIKQISTIINEVLQKLNMI